MITRSKKLSIIYQQKNSENLSTHRIKKEKKIKIAYFEKKIQYQESQYMEDERFSPHQNINLGDSMKKDMRNAHQINIEQGNKSGNLENQDMHRSGDNQGITDKQNIDEELKILDSQGNQKASNDELIFPKKDNNLDIDAFLRKKYTKKQIQLYEKYERIQMEQERIQVEQERIQMEQERIQMEQEIRNKQIQFKMKCLDVYKSNPKLYRNIFIT